MTTRKQLVWTRPIAPRWADAWLERIAFVGTGRTTVVEKPGLRMARLEAYPATKAVGDRLVKHFGGRLRSVSATAWFKASAPAKPLKLGKKLTLFSEAPLEKPEGAALIVPAGLAFGTGQHATTGMLLRELAAVKGLETMRCLDAGTGSGILALALRALGAKKVEAFDYDPVCVKTARQNEKLNFKTPSIAWAERDFLRWKAPRAAYDLICANLFSELLVQGAPTLARALKPGGMLLLSGVLQIQVPAVMRALKKAGLREERWKRRGKWTMARWGLPAASARR